jgi:hypothetical protein
MTLASFRTNPRVGHRSRIKCIYEYLYTMRNGTIRIRVEETNFLGAPQHGLFLGLVDPYRRRGTKPERHRICLCQLVS